MVDATLNAKLEALGYSARSLAWLLGKHVTHAALARGAGREAEADHHFANARLVASLLDAEVPALFPIGADPEAGLSNALAYITVTAFTRLEPALKKRGDDVVEIYRCALEVRLVEVLGATRPQAVASMVEEVKQHAARGRLPPLVATGVDAIRAAMPAVEATKKTDDLYLNALEALKSEKPPPMNTLSRVYLLGSVLASAVSLRTTGEDQEKAAKHLAGARELASELGVELPPLPPLSGEMGRDVAESHRYLLDGMRQVAQTLSQRCGAEHGALYEALVYMTVWSHGYAIGKPTDALFAPMLAALVRSGIPGRVWGPLCVLDAVRPRGDAFSTIYWQMRNDIKGHLAQHGALA